MILDTIRQWETYRNLGGGLARGLELLAGGSLDGLVEGRHELEGDRLYASVQEYLPKPPAAGRWEAHRRYADIQYLAWGTEAMGWCPVGALEVSDPYDEQKDIVFYKGGAELGTLLKVEARMFAVFFPWDAHMPMLSPQTPGEVAGSPAGVKKIVLKVALEF